MNLNLNTQTPGFDLWMQEAQRPINTLEIPAKLTQLIAAPGPTVVSATAG